VTGPRVDHARMAADVRRLMEAYSAPLPSPPVDWQAQVGRWTTAYRAAARAAGDALRAFSRTMLSASRLMAAAANSEARLAGLEARYALRGWSCSPAYRLGDIGVLVRGLMTEPWAHAPGDEELLMRLLTTASRARLAAAALRGYGDDGVEPTVLYWSGAGIGPAYRDRPSYVRGVAR